MCKLPCGAQWGVRRRCTAMTVAGLTASMVAPQPAAFGDTSHRGVTFASVVDFDPDRFNPIVGSAGDTYTQDNTPSFSEDDLVVPGTDGIKGGAFAEFSTSIDEQTNFAAPDTLRYLGKAFAQSGIINTQSNSINLGAAAQGSAMFSETVAVDTALFDTFMVAGQAVTTFARRGVQNPWGFSMRWDTAGSLKVEADLGFPQSYEVSFDEPTSMPGLPTSQTHAKTPFFQEVILDQDPVDISLDVLAEAVIVDGFMDKQGDVINVNDWPQVTAVTHAVVNLIPVNLGQTPNAPIQPEPASAWGQPLIDFLGSAIDFGIDALPASLIRQAIGDSSNAPGSIPAPGVAPGVAPGNALVAAPVITADASSAPAQDDLAIYLYMPTGSYYQVPFPDRDTQTFMTATGELILGIDDFSGLASPVRIIAHGVDLGLFDSGDDVDFQAELGHGVGGFQTITVGAAQTNTWSMQLRFDVDTAFLVVAVPEPSTLATAAAAITFAGLGLTRRRSRTSL